MTSMPVMDRNSAAQNYLSSSGTKTKTDSAAISFGQVMQQNSDLSVKQSQDPVKTSESSSKTEERGNAEASKVQQTGENAKSADNTAETADVSKTQEASKTKEVSAEEASTEKPLTEEDLQKISEAAASMVTAIAELLNISEQEVSAAMEAMGIEEVSLLNPDTVQDVIINLQGGTDKTGLLTDENLYNQVKELMTVLDDVQNELANQLDIQPEELDSILASLEKQPGIENAAVLISNEQESKSETDSIRSLGSPLIGGTKQETSEKTETFGKVAAADADNAQNGKMTAKDLWDMEQSKNAGDELDARGPMNGNTVQNSFAETVAEIGEDPAAYRMPTTREIMDQILDYMKLELKPEMDTLTMQLHPESLGSLHIQITSREGVMTAQFQTPNSDVKAVLEGQMMELKQNLEAQGIKVEAVEVTVGEFNLNADTRGQEDKQENENGKDHKKNGSAIRLEDIDLDSEETDPADLLTAEILMTERSTVSYTV